MAFQGRQTNRRSSNNTNVDSQRDDQRQVMGYINISIARKDGGDPMRLGSSGLALVEGNPLAEKVMELMQQEDGIDLLKNSIILKFTPVGEDAGDIEFDFG